MSEPERTLRDSPVDFGTAVAYALHPEMRRLLILSLVGSLLLSTGVSILASNPFTGVPLIDVVIALYIALVGAIFLFGGAVGALFKLVTDANRLAAESA